MAISKVKRDMKGESWGWLGLIAIMFLFPIVFFLCVFVPIWVGYTPRW